MTLGLSRNCQEFFAACHHRGVLSTDINMPSDVEQHDHCWMKQDACAGLDPRLYEKRG